MYFIWYIITDSQEEINNNEESQRKIEKYIWLKYIRFIILGFIFLGLDLRVFRSYSTWSAPLVILVIEVVLFMKLVLKRQTFEKLFQRPTRRNHNMVYE